MIIAIVGSRSFYDLEMMKCVFVNHYKKGKVDKIISGGAAGADTLAEQLAKLFHIDFVKVPADWKTYDKWGGFVRNNKMAKMADEVLAFWDLESKGTEQMIYETIKLNKPCYVYITAGGYQGQIWSGKKCVEYSKRKSC